VQHRTATTETVVCLFKLCEEDLFAKKKNKTEENELRLFFSLFLFGFLEQILHG